MYDIDLYLPRSNWALLLRSIILHDNNIMMQFILTSIDIKYAL